MLEVVALETFLFDRLDIDEAGLSVGAVCATDKVAFAIGCFDG